MPKRLRIFFGQLFVFLRKRVERLLPDHFAELRGLRAVFAADIRVRGAVLVQGLQRTRGVALVAEREEALRRMQLGASPPS